jgi:hypothetical protein
LALPHIGTRAFAIIASCAIPWISTTLDLSLPTPSTLKTYKPAISASAMQVEGLAQEAYSDRNPAPWLATVSV